MPFEQGRFSGLCGAYAIMNALAVLFPRRINDETGEGLFAAVLDAYPGPLRDLIIDGSERPEMECMLNGALAWTQAQGWPVWTWAPAHPEAGDTGETFWTRMRAALSKGRAALVVGFGEDDRPNSRYEPHWTCVEEVGPRTIYLKDSSTYKRVLRGETGVRPEPRWEIDDAFVLSRTAG
jgi:hypothetical protein